MGKSFYNETPSGRDSLAEARERLAEEHARNPEGVTITDEGKGRESNDPEELPERPTNDAELRKEFENEIEKKEKYADFTRYDVAKMVNGGATNEQIWEKAKEAGHFFKYDGSSYYLSKKDDKNPEDSIWRRRSARDNTSGSTTQKKIRDLVMGQLEKYRQLKDDFPTLQEAFTATDILYTNNVRRVTLNKIRSMSAYWDEIQDAASEEGADSSGDTENEGNQNTEKESGQEEPTGTKENKTEQESDFSAGDLVHWVIAGSHKWQKPKEIVKVVDDGEDAIAKFSSGEYAPLNQLKLAQEADSPREKLAEKLSEKIPEDMDLSDVLDRIEELSDEQKENFSWNISNIGYKVEETKANFLSGVFGKISQKFSGDNGEGGTMSRWFSALKNQFSEKQESARESMRQLQEDKESGDSGVWQKVKNQTADKWELSKNVLKTWGAIVSPRRQIMIAGLITATGAEAAKGARFANIDMLDKTRVQNAKDAADEAWAVHEAAQRKSPGLSGKQATTAALQQAYRESIPKDLLKRIDSRITDPGEAQREAQKVRNAAEQLPDRDYVSNEKLTEAFKKMFNDPEPGQNTGFVARLYEKQITKLAKKIDNKFHEIDANDSIGEIEKTARKNKILNRFGRLSAFEDYDRMLTQAGQIDGWAMTARNTEKAGKGVVAAMMAVSLTEIGTSIWDYFDTDAVDFDELEGDIVPGSSSEEAAGSGDVNWDGLEGDLTPGGDGENPFAVPAESTATDTGGATASESVQGDTEAVALGTQAFEIDEAGEGMIEAIADRLEGPEFGMSHEKAMAIGNALYVKGEIAAEGSADELYNLVGQGDTFALDFGDLQPGDLENYSTDELAKIIDFDQSSFDGTPSPDVDEALEFPDNSSSSDIDAAAGSAINRVENVSNVDVSENIVPDAGDLKMAPDPNAETAQSAEELSSIGRAETQESSVSLSEGEVNAGEPEPVPTPPDAEVPGADDLPQSVEEIEARAEVGGEDASPEGVEVRDYNQPNSSEASVDDAPADEADSGAPEGVETRPYEELAETETPADTAREAAGSSVSVEQVNQMSGGAARELIDEAAQLNTDITDVPRDDLFLAKSHIDVFGPSKGLNMSETIARLKTEQPQSLAVLENILNHFAGGDQAAAPPGVNVESIGNVLSYIHEQMDDMTLGNFGGNAPEYVRESLERSSNK